MKIAVVTDDGVKVSSHFGMAPAYHVFSVQDGEVVEEGERPKAHHTRHPHGEGGHGHAHGHADMFAPITDCQVLICGGMGEPAYRKALDAGLQVVLAGGPIRDTVQAYVNGTLESDPRRVHRHN